MKLIDKDALVQYLTGMAGCACCDENVERIIRKFIIPHIDTLEVKEVQREPVSEELEDAANEYCVGSSYSDAVMEKPAFKAGANWQRQKDEHLIWQISSANYEKGIEEGKQQMMKDAVEAEVEGISKSVLNGSWGYFKVEGNYKNGDKVRVIIIKDE